MKGAVALCSFRFDFPSYEERTGTGSDIVGLQSKSQNFDSPSTRRNSERKGLKIAWLLSRLFQELLNHLLLCCKFPNKGSTVSATFYLIISGKAVISEAPHKVVPKSSGGDYDGVGGF